jgi:predicted transglutaminase-like cysteine proteinase
MIPGNGLSGRMAVRHAGKTFVVAAALLALLWPRQPQAAFFAYPKTLKYDFARLTFATPSLAPMAHIVFCLKYPADCEVKRLAFRPRPVALTPERWNELRAVNTAVNRAIVPERNTAGLAGEKWLVAPAAGDCNDYAVTKRHELLAKGWPSRSLLLAEVATSWGEHHLVVVVRTREGDFVLDNLNANIRAWSKTNYQWVRVQLPNNPHFWSTVRPLSA